jgi:metal-dependent amidase/aminoacylase/carboxypeptidase family protein
LEQAVLSLGTIKGGTAHNILAEEVTITGALRTTSPSVRDLAKEYITCQAQSVAAAFGGRAEVEIKSGYDALINSDELVDLLIKVAEPILSDCHVIKKSTPAMGVEDFAFFAGKVPAVFFHLGCGKDGNPPLHSPEFFLDEACLTIGVRLEVELILQLLTKGSTT